MAQIWNNYYFKSTKLDPVGRRGGSDTQADKENSKRKPKRE